METLLELLRQRLVILFLILFTAIIMISPLASNTLVPNSADLVNHLSAIIQAKMGLAEGQLPLRVMPYLNDGLRYPFYQFYSPTANLIAGLLFMLTPTNPLITFKLIILLSATAGGIYMYRLANMLVNSSYVALLASLVYLTSPYYLIVLDHMNDFTEAFALGMLPITLYYTFKLFYFPSSLKFFLLMALSWYLLATIHLITFFYTLLFLVLLLTLFTIQNLSYWRNLLVLGVGFIFSIGLAAWFFLPIMEIKKFLVVENYYGVDKIIKYYITSFVSLLSPIANILPLDLKKDGVTDIIFKMRPNIGLPILLAMATSLYIFIKQKKINPLMEAWLLPLIITASMILLLVWAPFDVWFYLPRILTVGQYSWRLLGQCSWIGALLFAVSFTWLFPPETLTKKHLLLGGLFVIFSTSSWYFIPDVGYTYNDFPSMLHDPIFYSGNDTFLVNPRALLPRPISTKQKPMAIMKVEKSLQYCRQVKSLTKCSMPKSAQAELIQLPVLYYPKLLSIFLNGKKISYTGFKYKKYLLAAIDSIPDTQNNIEIKFEGLSAGNRISCLSWCLWIMLWLYQTKRFFLWLFPRKQEFILCQ